MNGNDNVANNHDKSTDLLMRKLKAEEKLFGVLFGRLRTKQINIGWINTVDRKLDSTKDKFKMVI
jgi:hypothetical protein